MSSGFSMIGGVLTSLALLTCGGEPAGTIGPGGGELSTKDGASVTVPPGALTEEIELRLIRSEATRSGALGVAYTLSPVGLHLQKPATVTLPLDPTHMLPTSTTEVVKIFRLPPQTGGTLPPEAGTDLGGTPVPPDKVQTQSSETGTFVPGATTPAVIAPAQGYPRALLVTPTHVYWTNYGTATAPLSGDNGTVARAALGAGGSVGAAEVYAAAQMDPRWLATDGAYLYWANGGSGAMAGDAGIMRGGLGQATPVVATRLITTAYPLTVATDGSYLYYTDGSDETVMRAAQDGLDVERLCKSGPRPVGMTLVNGTLYWVSQGTLGGQTGTVMKVPAIGGTPVTLASGQAEPVGLDVDGQHVYWVTKGDGKVQRVPVNGGAPELLRTLQRPTAITVAGDDYYVADTLVDRLLRYPKAGGAGTALSTLEGYADRVLLDARNIYWVTQGPTKYQGSVRVLAR